MIRKEHGKKIVPFREERPKLLSFYDMKNLQIDYSVNLLGNRWLERGMGAIVVAPSGIGKSVFVCQCAVCWACSREAFGIPCAGNLRQIIIQNEDSRNDLIEMARIIDQMELSPEEEQLVKTNVKTVRLLGVSGRKFIDVLKGYCEDFAPDLVYINPYLAYLGEGMQDDDKQAAFLYGMLSPVLSQYQCGAIPISHTTKTTGRKLEDLKLTELQYIMQGRSVMTNWARGVLAILPVGKEDETERVFRFTAAKRGERIGWNSYSTHWKWSQNAPHSKEKNLLWLPADDVDVSVTIPKDKLTSRGVLLYIPFPPKSIDFATLYEDVNDGRFGKERIGENRVRLYLKTLLSKNEIIELEIPRDYARPEIQYQRRKSG